MTRFTRWLDRLADPTDAEHPASDADEALRPLVAAALILIAIVTLIAVASLCSGAVVPG